MKNNKETENVFDKKYKKLYKLLKGLDTATAEKVLETALRALKGNSIVV